MLSILLSDHSNWTFFEFLVTLQIFLGRRSWIKIFGMFGIRGHQSSVQLVVHEALCLPVAGTDDDGTKLGCPKLLWWWPRVSLGSHRIHQQRCCGFKTCGGPTVSHRPCIYGKHGRWWWQKFLQNFFGGLNFYKCYSNEFDIGIPDRNIKISSILE